MFLDCRENLSETLAIKYKSSSPPNHVIKLKIQESTALARKAVGEAYTQLNLRRQGRDCLPIVDDVLARHFRGATAPQYLDLICKRFELTREGMNRGELIISDIANRPESPGVAKLPGSGKEEGYVKEKKNPAGASPPPMGSIHMAFDLSSTYSRGAIARVIIHEATHRFADTEDTAYIHQPKFHGLTWQQACDNADSYAYAALTILRRRIVTYRTMWERKKNIVPNDPPVEDPTDYSVAVVTQEMTLGNFDMDLPW